VSRRLKETDSYRFQIERVLPTYSFGAGSSFQDGPYEEFSHIVIFATCLKPKKLEGRLTRFALLGDRMLTCLLSKEAQPSGKAERVGSLTMRGKSSDYLGRVPWDVAHSVPMLIAVGALKYIDVIGSPLFRGASEAYSISFDADDDEDDPAS
jgi:hypothetical protein